MRTLQCDNSLLVSPKVLKAGAQSITSCPNGFKNDLGPGRNLDSDRGDSVHLYDQVMVRRMLPKGGRGGY